MPYRVTAALVVAKDTSGRNHHSYYGAVIPWLNDEQREHFLDLNLVEEIGEKALKAEGVPIPPEKPAKVAPKEAWVEWAVHNGHSREEAESLTKQELIDLFSE